MKTDKKAKELTQRDLYKPTAERLVVGALVIYPEHLGKIREILPDYQMFHGLIAQECYKTILELTDAGRIIDYVSLLSSNSVVTSAQLSQIMTEVPQELHYSLYPPLESVETYAKIIAEAYVKRELYNKLKAGEDIKVMMDVVAQLEKQGMDKFFSPREIALQVWTSFQSVRKGLEFPFKQINKATNGIHKGQLIVVAARPGTGKSVFIQNVGWHIASMGKKVLFASAEMSAEEIGTRILSGLIRHNMFYERENELSEELKKTVAEGLRTINSTPFYIHELHTIGQLENVIKERARDFDLVIIDYLQLLEPRLKTRSDYERVTAVANEITHIAKKYHLPIIAAAQYGRDAERIQPSMAELKNSGQIEQNSDVIISLWNHHEDVEEYGLRKVRYDILKNRNGWCVGNFDKTHQIYLLLNAKLFQFFEEGEEFKVPDGSQPPF